MRSRNHPHPASLWVVLGALSLAAFLAIRDRTRVPPSQPGSPDLERDLPYEVGSRGLEPAAESVRG